MHKDASFAMLAQKHEELGCALSESGQESFGRLRRVRTDTRRVLAPLESFEGAGGGV